MSFLYSVLLKLLYPTSLCLIFLVVAVVFRNRKRVNQAFSGLAIAILLVCGNGWVIGSLTRHLEWKYLPKGPLPEADCILVLSGGILGKIPPRPTVEVADAGDRVLYGATLFRQKKAPRIICTGNVATGGVAHRAASEDMAEFLEGLGVGKEAIITETKSEDTHQHAGNLKPLFREQGIKRVLLVTSAVHMPRSMGTFRKLCPDVEFIPAPTDFHATEHVSAPWYHALNALLPTPRHLVDFSEVMHEYVGMAYYKIRGWM
jgi:uncharacterized SAM-binding protein YcdF (DUF218 family)